MVEFDLAGLAGILAAFLGLVLTVYGVFFNGRATRELIHQVLGSVEAGHRDTRALIESTYHDTRTLLDAIHMDVQTTQAAVQAVAQNGQRRHDDLVAYMQDMDRRHSELLAALATKP